MIMTMISAMIMIMIMMMTITLANLVGDIVRSRPVELAHIVDGLTSSVEARVHQSVR